MGPRLILGAACLILVLSGIAAVGWWVILSRQSVDLEAAALLFLSGVATIQWACIGVAAALIVRARRVTSVGLALAVLTVCFGSLGSNLLNGFTPVLGAPLGLMSLLMGIGLLVAMRRITKSCS